MIRRVAAGVAILALDVALLVPGSPVASAPTALWILLLFFAVAGVFLVAPWPGSVLSPAPPTRHARNRQARGEARGLPPAQAAPPQQVQTYPPPSAFVPPDEVPLAEPVWSVVAATPSVVPAPVRSLRIALVGEGTYPFGPGGVSLWCHQLIQGMPEHAFTAVALTLDGSERSMWTAPANLAQVVNIPLWGPASGRSPRLRPSRPSFVEAHRAFLVALLGPVEELAEPGEGPGGFEAALRAMAENARGGDVSRELVSDAAVQRLLDVWQMHDRPAAGAPSRLTLRDAINASSRIEHMLRPLSRPPLEADVCHLAMSGVSVVVGLQAKWAYGTPVVLSEHGVYLRERYLALGGDPASQPVKLLTTRFHRALTSAAYRSVDVLAPHSAFNRRWQTYGGGLPERMVTMYNGIDPADFPAADTEPDEPTIVFVGRIDRLKDLHTLIRAFAVVRAALPTARLRMFGPVTRDSEDYHRSCLALIAELGLAGAATFEGRIARTVEAYRAGHVVALTSMSEGFPFTIIESMSVGRPPVATDVGGVSEAVGDAGFIVPPRDHEAVAQACLTLLRDPDLRRQMGERARRRVLDQFTLQQWTDAYRDVYATLAGVLPQRSAARPPAARQPTTAPAPAAPVPEVSA
jgi:glycosyltransferase involved in cell wall biosynthesis